MDSYDIYSDFDIDKHSEKYINYLKVIIDSKGKIEYAFPSHQEKLIKILMQQKKITRDELMKLVPREYYCDMMTWLCRVTGCIAVWNTKVVGEPNRFQEYQLRRLRAKGLLKDE